jgi:hypothetical protein
MAEKLKKLRIGKNAKPVPTMQRHIITVFSYLE